MSSPLSDSSRISTYIPTRHHDTVAQLHNPLQVVVGKARRLFDLGHDGRLEGILGQFLVNQVVDFFNVGRGLHKTERHPVHADREHVLQVTAIFGCQRRDLKHGIWGVDPFAVLDLAGHVDGALQVVGPFGRDGELDLAVINEQVVADFGGGNDFGVRELDARVVALGGVEIQAKGLPEFEELAVGVGKFAELRVLCCLICNGRKERSVSILCTNVII